MIDKNRRWPHVLQVYCPPYVWLHSLFCVQERLVPQLARAGWGGWNDEVKKKDLDIMTRWRDPWGLTPGVTDVESICLLHLHFFGQFCCPLMCAFQPMYFCFRSKSSSHRGSTDTVLFLPVCIRCLLVCGQCLPLLRCCCP